MPAHGPRITLEFADDVKRWPPEVRSTVYRIVQESLTNIVRPAPKAEHVHAVITEAPTS